MNESQMAHAKGGAGMKNPAREATTTGRKKPSIAIVGCQTTLRVPISLVVLPLPGLLVCMFCMGGHTGG